MLRGDGWLVMLIDRYGRPLTHLRISVTSRCNYGCIFCHREGIISRYSSKELDRGEWRFLIETAHSLGIKYYKITGGEPLLREDIVGIVEDIVELGGIASIVTNGSLLEKYAKRLADTSLSHINVSLHSLDRELYKRITMGGELDRVINGILEAIDYGINIKIDYVVLSINYREFKKILDFIEKHGLDINIIELIPLGLTTSEYNKLHKPLDEIISYLERYSIDKYIREFQSRPVYVLPSGVKATVIKGFCNPELCMKCTRLRVTPSGYLKTCLFRNDNLVSTIECIVSRDRDCMVNAFKRANSLREPFFKNR